jgi:tRNA(Ile2) C34 agmatinyltransferase TiaS
MSEANVHFIEMAREAAATQQHYCQQCGKDMPHRMHSSGEWEYYTCKQCGTTRRYKVK